MPLLAKCNVTNMSFPSCTADNNQAFVSIIVPTRRPIKHPTFKSILTDLKTGKEHEHYSCYNPRSSSMIDYSPIGIFFRGTLTEYGELELDFENKDNIRALELFVNNTMYSLESNSIRAYDPQNTKELFDEGNYKQAWNNISASLRFYEEENIFIKTYMEFLPVTMSLIRGDAFEKMMSENFMREVMETFYYTSSENIEGMLLEERINMAENIYDSIDKKLENSAYRSVADKIKRKINNHNLDDDVNVFGRFQRDTITDYIFGAELDKLMFNEMKYKANEKDACVQIIKEMIFKEYIISCFEYLQIEFRRANTVSIEDYCNDFTYRHLQFITPLHEEQQSMNAHDDGYPSLIKKVAIFSKSAECIHATYIKGGDIESLEKLFGKIDPELLKNNDYNSVIYYDTICECYEVIKDNEFMKKYKEV